MRIVTLLVAASLCASCVTKEPPPSVLAEGCLLNSDCESPLVCAFRRCHTACETSRDCPAGLNCRPADRPFNVCLLPDEIRCQRDTDCVNQMTCGVDGVCRSACISTLACLQEQLCVQGVCADGMELINGTLPFVIDAGFTCGRNSDCPVGELCSRGVCIAECVNSRDCPVGATCVAGRCLGGRCALNSDCPPGQRCSPVGWCAPECLEPRDCPSGLACVNSVCTTPTPDAGSPVDAGVVDAGVIDAGTTDAGATDAGPRCVLNQDCANGRWCDEGTCAPPCNATTTCSGGRVCDTRMGTCVRACTQGCGFASVCDTSPDAGVDGGIGACLRACDGTFRCGLGERCSNGFCAPECVAATDCQNAHATCRLGQCVFDGTCNDDLDCAATEVCRLGSCSARPTTLVDAGPGQAPSYSCADPCDCRLGEWCSRGRCLPDPVPTHFFARDGGGDGRHANTPSGAPFEALADAGVGAVLALREGETWPRSSSFALRSGVSLAGGYKVCSPQRWVRGDALSTTLSVTGGVITANGVTNASLRSVTLVVQGPVASNDPALVNATSAQGLWLEHVRGRIVDPGLGSSGPGILFACTACPNLRATDLTLLSSGDPRVSLGLLSLTNSFGTFSRLTLEAQPPGAGGSDAIAIASPTGPIVLEDVSIADRPGRQRPSGIAISSCQAGAVRLERASVAWPSLANDSVMGVTVRDCDVVVRDLRLEGTAPTLPATASGISFERVGGTMENVSVLAPSASSNFTGITLTEPRAFTLRDVQVSATMIGPSRGVAVLNALQGPVLLERVHSFVSGTFTPNAALHLQAVTAQAGLRVVDSTFEATTNGFACSRQPMAARLENASATFERSRLRAWDGNAPVAVDVDSASSVGLFASHLWAGTDFWTSGCTTNRQAALHLAGAARIGASTLDAEGSAFQQSASSAIVCETSATLAVSSSILGGGRSSSPWLLAGCPTSAVRSTYFWFDRPAATVDPMDRVLQLVQADAGVFDVNGNALMPNVSCFEPALPDAGPSYRLRAGAPCLDRGTFSTRADGSPVLLDLDGRPRDGGVAPDLGCSER